MNITNKLGGAMEFANLTRRQIEWIQIKAYAKVYLYNLRFVDFVRFVWEYRKGAWEVFKKIALKRNSLNTHLDRKPSDYEQKIYSGAKADISMLITARDNWVQYQHIEAKRLKIVMQEF